MNKGAPSANIRKERAVSLPIDDFLAKHMPANLSIAVAWYTRLVWSIGQPKLMAKFRADTGNNFHPGKTPSERMIDKSSGRELEFVEDYVIWFNENVWGEE
jgi:hypothetical protein